MDVAGSSGDAIFGKILQFFVHNNIYYSSVLFSLIIEPPLGYFDVYFIGKKKSVYRNSYSFRSGLTQEDILAYHWDDEDRMFEVRDLIATTPENQFYLYLENPLEYGYYLYSISDLGMLVTWFSYVVACDCPSLIQIIHLHSSKIPTKSRVMLFTLLHQKVFYYT